MAALKRLRRHHKPLSTRSREHSRERREEGTISRPQRGATRLPTKHRKLMPQHEQLDIFGELAAPVSSRRTAENER
jgi:hypothetical protein